MVHELLSAANSDGAAKSSKRNTLYILYNSGTTGRKGILHILRVISCQYILRQVVFDIKDEDITGVLRYGWVTGHVMWLWSAVERPLFEVRRRAEPPKTDRWDHRAYRVNIFLRRQPHSAFVTWGEGSGRCSKTSQVAFVGDRRGQSIRKPGCGTQNNRQGCLLYHRRHVVQTEAEPLISPLPRHSTTPGSDTNHSGMKDVMTRDGNQSGQMRRVFGIKRPGACCAHLGGRRERIATYGLRSRQLFRRRGGRRDEMANSGLRDASTMCQVSGLYRHGRGGERHR